MAKSKKVKQLENASLLYTHGEAGLKRQGGIVDEEFHRKLRGAQGRRAIVEMMTNDSTIGASLWIFEAICRHVSWAVEEADSTSSLKVEAATVVDQAMRDMDRPWKEIVSEALTMFPFGWALMEPTYKIRRGPQFKEPTLRSNYTDGLYGWRDWALRAQESLYNWEFDGDGRPVAMWQQPPADFRLRCIPLDRALLFRLRATKGNPEGTSGLRCVWPRYFDGKRLREIEGIGIERNIAGMPVMQVPSAIANAKAGTPEYTIKQAYLKLVKQVRLDAYFGLLIPSEDLADGKKSGYKFGLLSSSGNSFANANIPIQRNAKEIAMAMMTEHMFLGTDKVGALATSSDKTNMLGYGIEALLDIIQDITNTIAIPRLMRANDYPFDAYPTWNHSEVSRRAVTEIFGAVTSAISSGALEAGDDIDKYLREQLDLKARRGPRLDDVAGADAGDVADEEAARPAAQSGLPAGQMELPLPGSTAGVQPFVEIADNAPELPYITIDDIAAQLGVSRNSVIGALRSGKIPGAKVGNSWRIPREDFTAYMRGGNMNSMTKEYDPNQPRDDSGKWGAGGFGGGGGGGAKEKLTWAKSSTGDYSLSNGKASLVRDGKKWKLKLKDGREFEMPKRASFDHAESILSQLGDL